MEWNLQNIINIAIIAINFVLVILAFIKSSTKNPKTKERATTIFDVVKKVQELICFAETNVNYSGAEKKLLVKTYLSQFLANTNISLTEEQQDILIENEISLSNQVNVDKKTVDTEKKTETV